ncbi:hypothetical protein BHM03_00014529 [Ensete ventricosum]|nr:hypothetical protein BHM03_00014529 [Ensete ventricosum]
MKVNHDGQKELQIRHGPRIKLKHRAKVLEDAVGARWKFARRFVEGIGKLARNTPRDRRMKTMRLTAGDFGGCRNAGVRSLSLVVMLGLLLGFD